MLNFRILNIFNFLNLVVIPFPDALRCSSVDRGNWGGGGGGRRDHNAPLLPCMNVLRHFFFPTFSLFTD